MKLVEHFKKSFCKWSHNHSKKTGLFKAIFPQYFHNLILLAGRKLTSVRLNSQCPDPSQIFFSTFPIASR